MSAGNTDEWFACVECGFEENVKRVGAIRVLRRDTPGPPPGSERCHNAASRGGPTETCPKLRPRQSEQKYSQQQPRDILRQKHTAVSIELLFISQGLHGLDFSRSASGNPHRQPGDGHQQ